MVINNVLFVLNIAQNFSASLKEGWLPSGLPGCGPTIRREKPLDEVLAECSIDWQPGGRQIRDKKNAAGMAISA